jgi:succinate dehydrogenase / fumarate reductase cytochrome b subunit
MAKVERPLSPHLGVYRFQITMTMSILHRITGVGLGLGTLLMAWWLIALAVGPGAFDMVQDVVDGWFGRLVLLGFTASFAFHFFNGIRHLAWDLGLGFALPTMRASGWTVVALTVIVTVLIWVAAYALRGM